jgi:hypothetical protein
MPRLSALGSSREWCFVTPGCIFERGTEARRKAVPKFEKNGAKADFSNFSFSRALKRAAL